MQIKTTQISSHPKMAATEKTTNAGKEAEKRESSHTVAKNAIWLATMIISKNEKIELFSRKRIPNVCPKPNSSENTYITNPI